jgi:hypothetical protein
MSAAMSGGTHTRRGSYIGLAIFLTIATAMGAAQYGWWRYLGIAVHQVMAEGTVLSTNCGNNNQVTYSFSVQGSALEGSDSSLNCRTLRPGDRLAISFSSRDPAQNMPGDAYATLIGETISILVACVLASILIVAVFVGRFGKRRS